MSHDLPKAYDPSLIEARWAEYWVRERIFDVPTPDGAEAEDKKAFTMLLPPPNVTGRLHIGHMFEQTEMDILTRWHRMCGDTALWVPGTDHAGIATQLMVERQLRAEGLTRQQLGREAFEARVWQWKSLYGNAILEQMKRLGSTVDWSREYFTMDDRLSVAVKEAFVRLYEQGLIYRGAYIVNWDSQIQSAVSDLEVESEERPGQLFHIRYDLADGSGSITIATTRPETMLGDVAVAVNPTDERYTHLVGKLLKLPLVGREIPIIADDWAKPEFGTGAVKITPAHDPNDFAIGKRHTLPSYSIMDEQARIAIAKKSLPWPDEWIASASKYNGLDRFEARECIVADLESTGHLTYVEDHALTLPISQRTGAIIEPRLSMQWFLDVNKNPQDKGLSMAGLAKIAVENGYIKITPNQYSKTYLEWMSNIHDWCISRQLWWGHRIPAWHCSTCRGITVSREAPTICENCKSSDITQETDVLDTWFSSGLLPFTVFGWTGDPVTDGANKDLADFYPTQLLVTGFDILFFWVARMVMLGCHFMQDVPMPDGSKRSPADAVPFREVYIHALVRDADRQKMSKTKGNVVDPIEVITKFGTDAVRFTLASMASPGTDIAFSEARTEGNRAFANKIWNAARFLFMNIERARESGVTIDLGAPRLTSETWAEAPQLPLETRWILSRLHTTAAEVNKSLADYRFDEAASAVYQFFWGDLCDWYLEIIKLRLVFGTTTPEAVILSGAKDPDTADAAHIAKELSASNEAALTSLKAFVHVFESALRLLSPFMPFITEEIWHALHNDAPRARSIALTRFPQAGDFTRDENAVSGMRRIQAFITTIRSRRKELGVPEKEAVDIEVVFDARSSTGSTRPDINNVYRENLDIIQRLARVSNMDRMTVEDVAERRELAWVSAGGPEVAVLYRRTIDVPAERERLTKDLAKYEKGIAAADRQLTNDAFMARAPAHIVEGLRKQSAETRMLYDKTKTALDTLPSA